MHRIKIKYKPNGTGRYTMELPTHVEIVRDVKFKKYWWREFCNRLVWIVDSIDYRVLNWRWERTDHLIYKPLNRSIEYSHRQPSDSIDGITHSCTTNSYYLSSDCGLINPGILTYDVVRVSIMARSNYIYVYYDSKVMDREKKLDKLGV
jgi:hypothetical protein